MLSALFLLILFTTTPLRAYPADYRFLDSAGVRAPAPPETLPGESSTRFRMDLGGRWAYAVEGGPAGEVDIPCAYDFSGKVAFQRTFQVSAEAASKYRFHVVALGINQNAEITINNDFITNHSGGYTTIYQSVPANTVQAGQNNVLRVLVNNALDYRKGFPLRPLPWMLRNYGGILRDIYILGTPLVYIRDAAVTAEIDQKTSTARVRVRIAVDLGDAPGGEAAAGGPRGYVCTAEMLDKISGMSVGRSSLVPVVKAEGGGVAAVEFTVQGPKLWSPDSPELYLLRCSLYHAGGEEEAGPVDEFNITYGLRQVRVAAGNILLNGSRIVLKGVIWNEDHPDLGSALTFEQMEKDVAQIKTLGANVIQFAYHPPHPYMLDLCDRYGLLAMEEIPAARVPGPVFEQDGYMELARAMLREMIVRDRNHPSVIAWGLGDGMDMSQTATRAAVEQLAGLARAEDTRLVYAAARPLATDICTDLLDIAAVTPVAHDAKEFRSQLESWREMFPDKPVVAVRFGAEVQHENRRGYTDPLSQEAQARFFLQRFDVLKAIDYDGGILQSFNDWRGARPSLTVHSKDPWAHNMGLVSASREKRLAFDAVRALFHGEKFSALPLGQYSSKASIIFVLAGFAGLVGLAYLYNASRRFRESLNRSLMNSYNFFSDIRDQHMVAPAHTFLLGLGVSLGTAIVVSSIAFHYRDDWFADNLLTLLLVSDTLKAFIVRLIWDPLACIGFVTGAVFLGLVLLSLVIYAIRVFFHQRIYLPHAITIAFWSTAPFLAFIPIGMIMYRVMESPVYITPVFALVALLHLWVVLRMLKGLSIVYDVFPLRMYATGLVVILLMAAGVYLYYDAAQSVPMYVRFMVNMTSHTL